MSTPKNTMPGGSELRALDDEMLDLEFDRDPANKYATAYDLKDMDALGLTPAFRRRFKFLAMIGFSSTVVTPWQTTLATFTDGWWSIPMGWLCTLAWITMVAGCGIIIGNLIKYCLVVYYPDSAAFNSQWFPTILAITAIIAAALFNTFLPTK